MKGNKIIIYVFLAFLLAGTVLSFFITPLIISAAKRQIQSTFPASAVSIEKCHFNPKGALTFSDINIKREGVYNLTIKEISIKYSIPHLFRGYIDNVSIDNPLLMVNSRQYTTENLREMINISKGGIFGIHEVVLSGAQVKLTTHDLHLDGRFSLRFFPEGKTLTYIDSVFNTCEIRNISFKEMRIKGNPDPDIVADLSIKKTAYNKAGIEDLTGVVRSDGAGVSLDSLNAQLFNGSITGAITLAFDENKEFSMDLNCVELDLDTVVKDFDLDEKLQITGKLSGTMSVNGRNFDLADIQGTFKTVSGGGLLTIKDPDFLKKLAGQPGQSLDLAAESFKNYVYTAGTVKISFDKGNIVLSVEMDGDSGKRTFNIVLHDIVLIKRGTL